MVDLYGVGGDRGSALGLGSRELREWGRQSSRSRSSSRSGMGTPGSGMGSGVVRSRTESRRW